jgi:broad-specificity NMP kinase
MKVLITGSSTTGKTSVIHELQRRGYTAVDGDNDPELVRLEVKETGEPARWPRGYVDWSYYSWNLQKPALEKILAQDETVIIGGIFGNQADFYGLFDMLIVLTMDSGTYGDRLKHRPRREVGDHDLNMDDRKRKYPVILKRFLDAGAIPVTNDGTVGETADKIIKLLGSEA